MLKKITIACLFAFSFLTASAQEDPALMGTESMQQQVKVKTSMGDFVIELEPIKAPITVENFLVYVDAGFYDGTIFHRVIRGFMIQGGGFEAGLKKRMIASAGLPRPPIENEGHNGLKNEKFTIAMARTPAPESATSQFFINVNNNAALDYVKDRNPGYAVFGKVLSGEDVVEKISKLPTGSQGAHQDVPVETVRIISIRRFK